MFIFIILQEASKDRMAGLQSKFQNFFKCKGKPNVDSRQMDGQTEGHYQLIIH